MSLTEREEIRRLQTEVARKDRMISELRRIIDSPDPFTIPAWGQVVLGATFTAIGYLVGARR